MMSLDCLQQVSKMKIHSLDQINNIQDTTSQIVQFQQFCNKHSNKIGQYFSLDSPWIRFCETCALNIAVCGKKIQKCLTASQMFNKINLSDALKQMQQSINQSQIQYHQYSSFIKQTQSTRNNFINMILQIQKYIQKLSQYKIQLEDLVYQKLSKQLKNLFERQNVLISKKFQLLKNVSKIQCQYTKILQQNNKSSINDYIKQCRNHIQQCQLLFLSSNYKDQMNNNIIKINQKFQENIKLINSTKINIQFQNLQNVFNITNKRIDTLNESTIHTMNSKLNMSTISGINSGLQSRAQTNNEIRNPLEQINVNKRSSRAFLQLRTRCNTKSVKKAERNRIQIDVRQEIKQINMRVKTKNE